MAEVKDENTEKLEEKAGETASTSVSAASTLPTQTLKSSSTTHHGDQTQTTHHGDQTRTLTRTPKTTTTTSYSTSGFLNPDGTPNTDAQKEFDAGRAELQNAYHIDPESGKVDKKYITEIVGVDPEEMKRKRAQEMRLNQSKQKESALYNALAVLTDMMTTAGGGNVWKRDADKHAKDAHDDNIKLEKEQAAEDKGIAKAMNASEQAYAAAVAALRDKVGTKYGAKVSETKEVGGDTTEKVVRGNDTTTIKRGNDYTTGRKEVAASGSGRGSGSGSGSGSSGLATVKIGAVGDNGLTTYDFHIRKSDYEALGRYLSTYYNGLTNSQRKGVDELLASRGMHPDAKTGQYTGADILSSGIIIDDPAVINEYYKIIDGSTEYTPEGKKRVKDEMAKYLVDYSIHIMPNSYTKGSQSYSGASSKSNSTSTSSDNIMPGISGASSNTNTDDNTMPGLTTAGKQ